MAASLGSDVESLRCARQRGREATPSRKHSYVGEPPLLLLLFDADGPSGEFMSNEPKDGLLQKRRFLWPRYSAGRKTMSNEGPAC